MGVYFRKPQGFDTAFNDSHVSSIIMNLSDEYNTFQINLNNPIRNYNSNTNNWEVLSRNGTITYPNTIGVNNTVSISNGNNGIADNYLELISSKISDEDFESMHQEGLLDIVSIEARDTDPDVHGPGMHKCEIKITLGEGQTLQHGLIPAMYVCCPILIEYNTLNPNYTPSSHTYEKYTTAYGNFSEVEIRIYGVTDVLSTNLPSTMRQYLSTNYPVCNNILFGGYLSSDALCNLTGYYDESIYANIFEDIGGLSINEEHSFDAYPYNIRIVESVITYDEDVRVSIGVPMY